MKRFLCAASIAALGALPAYADANGDMWEVTSQMTMEGMPAGMGMPAQTRRVCSTHEWTKPPVAGEERGCKTTDFKTTPTKTSWKMTCPDASGEGEITRTSPDAYTGWIKIAMSQGAMTMNLSGKRVGDCDAGEAKKERDAQVAQIQGQVAASQKAASDAQDQTCMGVAQSVDLPTFNQQVGFGMCKDPKYKAALCETAKKCDMLKKLVQREQSQPESGLAAVAAFCGFDVAAITTACCDDAVKTVDTPFLTAHCPAQAKALALEKCAGLGYSALMGTQWQAFCTSYAKDLMEGGAAAPPKKKSGKSSR